jgi:hypothetical protein
MKMVLEARASTILYDLLMSRGGGRPFLLPANVCPIVPLTFLKARVPFQFVDISPGTLHLDLDEVQARLGSRAGVYGGILYVHTYGDPSTPNQVFAEIKEANPELLLIDDRCLCVPALEPDASSMADVVLFSTGHAKIVDQGVGGYAFLKEHVACAHRPLPYQHHDLEVLEARYKQSIHSRQPYKYTDSDWLQTAADLPLWPEYARCVQDALIVSLEQRRRINAVYDALIPAELRLPAKFQLWRYNIRLKDSRSLLAAISRAGLFASAHYASLAGLLGSGTGSNASELADHVVNLFNDHHYTLEMAERTAQIILGSL